MIHRFNQDISSISVPEKFTFPFYYEPHDLVKLAFSQSEKLIIELEKIHHFGLDSNRYGLAIGKMFGILVVKDKDNELGFLFAFSGKLANSNHHKGFVPPVFDLLDSNSFFLEEEEKINKLNKEIESLQNNVIYKDLKENLNQTELEKKETISNIKYEIKINKEKRQLIRSAFNESYLDLIEIEKKTKNLAEESRKEQLYLKYKTKEFNSKIEAIKGEIKLLENEIEALKHVRAIASSDLQKKIFSSYFFINYNGEKQSLFDTFHNLPPAGAGECAMPKLLQYAFTQKLQPIAMGEFWWGKSPPSEIRNHKTFYPSCKSKCEPILNFMLQGIELDENPLIKTAEISSIPVIYEDEYCIVFNKPHEFLTVPGISIKESLYNYVQEKHPTFSGPLIVHRLDMSTSGIVLIAKTKQAHKEFQRLFIKRKIKKTYLAILNGLVKEENGQITFPIRLDIDDRPRQVYCEEFGKEAITDFEVLKKNKSKTLIQFFPLTGRTHQLRVHAAHEKGLKTAILGDDLYGLKSERLFLHAYKLNFIHPFTKKEIEIEASCDFIEKLDLL